MIQSGEASISLAEYKYVNCTGETYTFQTEVKFGKEFANNPMVQLSVNGISSELESGIPTPYRVTPYFKNYTVKIEEISKSGFIIKLYLPSNKIDQKYAALYGILIAASWMAYDEVTIGP